MLIPNPSWANHRNIFERCGLTVQQYRWGQQQPECSSTGGGNSRHGAAAQVGPMCRAGKVGCSKLYRLVSGRHQHRTGYAAKSHEACCHNMLLHNSTAARTAGTTSLRLAAWTTRCVQRVALQLWHNAAQYGTMWRNVAPCSAGFLCPLAVVSALSQAIARVWHTCGGGACIISSCCCCCCDARPTRHKYATWLSPAAGRCTCAGYD